MVVFIGPPDWSNLDERAREMMQTASLVHLIAVNKCNHRHLELWTYPEGDFSEAKMKYQLNCDKCDAHWLIPTPPKFELEEVNLDPDTHLYDYAPRPWIER